MMGCGQEAFRPPELRMTKTVVEFEAQVARTDRRKSETALRIAILGIFGELGSLASEVKKRLRDGKPYHRDRAILVEEAGDLLWYFAALGITIGYPLHQMIATILGTTVDAQTTWREVDKEFSALATAASGDAWLDAAEKAGLIAGQSKNPNSGQLNQACFDGLRACLIALRSSGISLHSAVNGNVRKSNSRFPELLEFPRLYDDRKNADKVKLPIDEMLPKRMSFEFDEVEIRGKKYVKQKVFQINIGDPLTDNISEQDDYRFHDVFHLAYAATLGWSPVLRALLKAKRKSAPSLDENEDGARAILIEEGISSWIFNKAKPHYFDGATRIDYDILKTISDFVQGYEVQDQPFWTWERAILRGYDVFRELKAARRGRVDIDLVSREIRFFPIR